ncbi:MAG: hypothetical protein JWO45_1613 [Spartobacteria bacterium]|nr:hypothetical protein [Spartobacteria bacterium]
MAFTRKVLWIVNMDTDADEKAFAQHVEAAGIDTVCIRTSSARLPDAIGRFKALPTPKTVWAWKWPGVISGQSGNHYYADDEAKYVATVLIPKGLDGYIVDPESDGHVDKKTGLPRRNDWDQSKLAPVAKAFCKTIKDAAAGKPFLFGTTSGCAYPAPTGKPNIPWAEFFPPSDALYPQCYWRMRSNDEKTGKEVIISINGGSPATAVARGMPAWTPKAGGKKIIPMAGEIDLVTKEEIAAYGAELTKLGLTEAHFYADVVDPNSPQVPAEVYAAIKAL